MITVQIGQCGNQIGEKLFETLINDFQDPNTIINSQNRFKQRQIQQSELRDNEEFVNETKKRFFTEIDSRRSQETLAPRAVLIDMESKVCLYRNKQLFR